jgi:hypothetical protein
MIKKQQRWIALLVALTFMWLLQVSTMPLAAANTTERVSSANNDQGPRFIEEEGNSNYQSGGRRSILPIILIVAGVATLTAVVLILVLANNYDITGTWTLYYTWAGYTTDTATLVFSGDKKSGSFYSSNGGSGTYTVNSKNVTWTYTSGTRYTGTFSDKKNMSGTMLSYDYDSGTWTATKTSSTSSFHSPMAAKPVGGMNDAGKIRK